jgi:phage shock protein PspC (stress-responsive transcriptional regulator)/two-component sensor histidine kinase
MRGRSGTGNHGAVTIAAVTADPAAGRPTLYRRSSHRLLGGVAGGIADHLRVPVLAIRVVFVLLSFAGGVGALLYCVYWIVVPTAPGTVTGKRAMLLEYGAAAVVFVAAIVFALQGTPLGSLFVPAVLGCVGGALIWRPNLSEVRDGLVGVAVAAVGIAVITGPWWVKLVNEVSAERRERVQSQARADLADRVHDSVLQTLALIQRNASSPREVARLARGQERELRGLLYGTPSTSSHLADALRAAAAEVEDAYGIVVSVVAVGDAELDEPRRALVAATREALVNAAKHSGMSTVSLYAEVELESAVAFIRDRGRGFDPAEVADDRQGLRNSIIGRIERFGGQVTVRSAAGEGTEVEIRLGAQ